MTGRQSLVFLLLQGVVGALVLVLASALCYADKLDGESVVALFGSALGLIGGAGATISYATTNGNAQRQVTQRQAAGLPGDGSPPGGTPPPAAPAA